MNNCPAFGYGLARELIRAKTTFHMVKELIDIYKTLQSLPFQFGSTLSLSDLLSVWYKPPVLHTNYEVYMCIHKKVCVYLCVCVCLSVWLCVCLCVCVHAPLCVLCMCFFVDMERLQENIVS